MTRGSGWYAWLWLGLCLLWTFGLVAPGHWFGQTATVKVGEFSLGKILHVVVYALLAGSAGWLPLPMIWRLVIALPLLSAHGALTEFLQLHISGREGSVRDWIINTAGVMLGFTVTWRRWPTDTAADTR